MNFTKLSEKVFTTVYAKLLLLGTLLFATASSFGQAPPNDNACQATQLTPGTTCTYVQSTNVNGTTSTGTVSPSCAGFAAGRADVWFYAIVPAGGALPAAYCRERSGAASSFRRRPSRCTPRRPPPSRRDNRRPA